MNKTFKKALSVVLVLMMVVSTMVILPMTASAEEAALGTAANPIKIATAADAATLLTTLETATADSTTGQIHVILTADVDLGGGTASLSAAAYTLNLDGQGHTVSNYKGTGLFDSVGPDSTIANLNVANATLSGANTGAIVAYARLGLWLINCSTAADVTVTSTNNHGGGLVGTVQSKTETRPTKFVNCVNNATVANNTVSGGGCAGGIASSVETANYPTIFENCTNNGTVTGGSAATTGNGVGATGGMVGKVYIGVANTGITFKNCKNLKPILSKDGLPESGAGGMMGYIKSLAAILAPVKVENCVNRADVTGVANAGGMIGFGKSALSFDFDYCANIGNIKAAEGSAHAQSGGVGGMIGDVMHDSHTSITAVNFDNCYNTGDLTMTAKGSAACPDSMGGMIGQYRTLGSKVNNAYQNTMDVNNCYDFSKRTTCDAGNYNMALVGFAANGELKTKNFTNCYAANKTGTAAPYKVFHSGGKFAATNSEVIGASTTPVTTYAEAPQKVADGIAAINAVLYAPDISTASGNLEVRLKLTDDFGLMAITEADGFYFSTDANVKNGTKVAGQTYNGTGKVYAVYDEVTAATLDTTIYFAAYVTINGVDCLSEVRAINPYTMAKDLADGYYGAAGTGVLVTENTHEMALYTEMANYCDAYKAYMDAIA